MELQLRNADDIAIATFIGRHLWKFGVLCLGYALFRVIKDFLNMGLMILKVLYLTNLGKQVDIANVTFKFWVAPLWFVIGLLILLWR